MLLATCIWSSSSSSGLVFATTPSQEDWRARNVPDRMHVSFAFPCALGESRQACSAYISSILGLHYRVVATQTTDNTWSVARLS